MKEMKSQTSVSINSENLMEFRRILERQKLTQSYVFGEYVKAYNIKYGNIGSQSLPPKTEVVTPVVLDVCGKCGSEYNSAVVSRCPGCVDKAGKDVEVAGVGENK